MAGETTKPYLTVAEAAAVLEISSDGVYKLIRRGKLPALKLSERGMRITRWALDAYVDSLNGIGPDTRLPAGVVDPDALRVQFEVETGLSPEAWVSAWKRGDADDSAEGSTRLVRALALRQSRGEPPVAMGEDWAIAAFGPARLAPPR